VSLRQTAVIDTNVVVAGLLTANARSPVAQVLDGMLAAAFPFVVSESLLAEYRAVLVRPALRKLHGLTVAEIEALLIDIALHAIVRAPAQAPPAPDPGDQLLWDLFAAHSDLILITGDKLLLRDADMAGRVLSPADFLERS